MSSAEMIEELPDIDGDTAALDAGFKGMLPQADFLAALNSARMPHACARRPEGVEASLYWRRGWFVGRRSFCHAPAPESDDAYLLKKVHILTCLF